LKEALVGVQSPSLFEPDLIFLLHIRLDLVDKTGIKVKSDLELDILCTTFQLLNYETYTFEHLVHGLPNKKYSG
jgi:hypothetical protein